MANLSHAFGFASEAREEEQQQRTERPAKTRCPTCGKLFKCVEAHHLVKHGTFAPVGGSGK